MQNYVIFILIKPTNYRVMVINWALPCEKIRKTMSKKILITGTCLYSRNRGVTAIGVCTKKILEKCLNEVDITILRTFPGNYLPKPTTSSHIDFRIVDDSNTKSHFLKMPLRLLRALLWSSLHKYFKLDIKGLINDKVLSAFRTAEIIVDLSYGDGFTDMYGWMRFISSFYLKLLPEILGRPVVIFHQTIGPFGAIANAFAKIVLDKAEFIIVREKPSMALLLNMGLDSKKIFIGTDVAFLLERTSPSEIKDILVEERIFHKRPIVGISVSQFINLKYTNPFDNNYLHVMTEVVNFLTESMKALVILVPHVTSSTIIEDDRFVGKALYERVKHKNRVRTLHKEYIVEDLWGLIAHCDLFIGSRTHTVIAATSACVPTVSITYSHKTYGIMKMLGQEKYIVDFNTMSTEEILSKIKDCWAEKDQIKKTLTKKIKMYRLKAFVAGNLINNYLRSNGCEICVS